MLVWACIAPHGGELIPELANGNLHRMAATRQAMEELGRRCSAARPDALIVYTPHGICVDDHFCVSVSRRAVGHLDGDNGQCVQADFGIDRRLALALCDEA